VRPSSRNVFYRLQGSCAVGSAGFPPKRQKTNFIGTNK
jgi:hypothetical protein